MKTLKTLSATLLILLFFSACEFKRFSEYGFPYTEKGRHIVNGKEYSYIQPDFDSILECIDYGIIVYGAADILVGAMDTETLQYVTDKEIEVIRMFTMEPEGRVTVCGKKCTEEENILEIVKQVRSGRIKNLKEFYQDMTRFGESLDSEAEEDLDIDAIIEEKDFSKQALNQAEEALLAIKQLQQDDYLNMFQYELRLSPETLEHVKSNDDIQILKCFKFLRTNRGYASREYFHELPFPKDGGPPFNTLPNSELFAQ